MSFINSPQHFCKSLLVLQCPLGIFEDTPTDYIVQQSGALLTLSVEQFNTLCVREGERGGREGERGERERGGGREGEGGRKEGGREGRRGVTPHNLGTLFLHFD